MDEKRKAERVKEEHEVTITVISDKNTLPKEKIINSYSMDVSVSGTKIKTNVILPVDTLLMVNFSLDDLHQKINAIGQVKWIKVIIEDESYEEGVKFDNPSRKLADYIAWKQKSKDVNLA
jgi:hypothetical protein